jgi:probable F420-dependent oxidoreductase
MSESSENRRRLWTVLAPLPAAMLTPLAQLTESRGIHGIFVPQVYGPPFTTLGAIAAVTERVQLASGIAIAPVRSPFETAMAAIDLDRISNGRFILGLGTSVHAWTAGVFGTPKYKPVSHLRETVAAVRHIIKGAHKGLTPFHGEYYRADFRELQPSQPPVRDEIPIWIAALRAPLVRLAAEIGDGLIGHPMWSVEWALDQMQREFTVALAAAGRRRDQVEVNLWPWVAPHDNEAEATQDARPTMAFYGGIKQYEPFFEAHGFGAVARQLQAGVRRGDYLSVAHLVPDDMVRTFVGVGKPEKVRERVERLWTFADSLCPVAPVYALSTEKLAYYSEQIAQTFGA